MHLPDNVLSTPVLAGTWALAAGGLAVSLRRLTQEQIPQTGIFSALFFVVTLVAIPLPLGSVHLLLNGLLGVVLGWGAVPAILGALLLQAIQFGHGGYSSLGANTVVMALPALLAGAAFRRSLAPGATPRAAFLRAAVAAGAAVLLSCLLQAGCLALSDRAFLPLAGALLLGHLPVLALDGLVTGWTVAFLQRVRPELLRLTPQENAHAG